MKEGLKGSVIILTYLVGGELISWLIKGFVPGNVIGMILLFTSLQMHIVEETSVASVCKFLTKYMAIMFLPPAMGLLAIYIYLGENIITIILTTLLSAMFVLAIVGKMQDKLGKKE